MFAAGTMRWVCALTRTCGHGAGIGAQRFTGIATVNLLRAFAAGPAGPAHPARDNLAALHEARGFGAASGD